MSDTSLQEKLEEALPRLKGLGAVIGFDLGADGKWLVDASGAAPTLSQCADLNDAVSTISLTSSNLFKLLDGNLDAMVAYGLGRIKVSGSKGVAMKLVTALS